MKSSLTSAAGETDGHRWSSRSWKLSEDGSSRSNQGSSASRRPAALSFCRASPINRDRRASRPALYGAGRAAMDAQRSFTSSARRTQRADRARTHHVFDEPGGGAAPRAAARSAAMRGSPLSRRTSSGVLRPHRAPRRQVGHGGLHHRLLPQRRQHLRDVAQEGAAGPEHEHAVAGQRRMVVEEEGGPVQSHGRLPGARPSLHGQQLTEGGADDLVLLGLDGGDDVQHLAGPGPLELGQQRIAAAQAGARQLAGRLAEEVVGHRDDPAPIDHHLSPALQPEGLFHPGPIEGHGDRGPPVDDDRVAQVVLYVAPPDVPGGARRLVDPPEEERSRALARGRPPGGPAPPGSRDRAVPRCAGRAGGPRPAPAWPTASGARDPDSPALPAAPGPR